MKKSHWITSTGLVGMLSGAGSVIAADAASDISSRPNVVIIFADDLGYGDVGFNGCTEIPTPHIDSIAENGVVFSNGYVSCPVCGPSRAGLLSGRYQNRLGFEDNPGPFRQSKDVLVGFPLEQETIADRMKALGYATGMVGKQHDGRSPELHPEQRGFDEFFGFNNGASDYFRPRLLVRGTEPVEMREEYLTDELGREASEFIERHKDHPFFLYVPFNAPHGPMQAKERHLRKFKHIEGEKRRKCVAMIYSLDENIGKILEALRENDLEENTLIVFLSDNGGGKNMSSNGSLHGMKGELYDGGTHIPFCMQWKGTLPAGATFESPVISLDLLPTVVVAAGGTISKDWNLDGVNLVPFITGEKTESPHDQLTWRFLFQHAYRNDEWKLVKPKQGEVELYRISDDPNEKENVIRKYPKVAKQLQSKFDRWAKELPSPQWGWQPAFCGKIKIDKNSPDRDW